VHLAHVIVLASATYAGCTVGAGSADSDPKLDAMMLARVDQYQRLPRINARPYASILGPFDVNCFVAGDFDSYRRIHPERPGSGVTIVAGTVIVREVLDERGRPAKLTVMAKGPPGFDPSLGDWWFAVTDPRGVPLEEDGVLQIGRMQECHDCHRERTRDDFLFGVPAAAE
jgi:hypothetical protein